MSTAPARTRSLRKPAAESSRYGKSTTDVPAETPRERGDVSPSRLPKPPSSATASASLSRSSNISRPVTSASNGSTTRPSSQRTGVSRPPLTSENKNLPHRSGARTPTEANSSLQRAPGTRHSRNSSTSALLSRPPSSSGSSNTANRTQLFPSSASTLIRPPSSASVSTQSSHAPDANRTTTHRPVFSTLQQHFSPARSLAPKPPTSTFLAPPSPSKHPAAIAASAETARLQAELLQLHLLHRSAAPTCAEYCSSAKRKLRARFEDVRDANEDLVELEAIESDQRNIRALQAWADDGVPGWGLEEKIQALDQVLGAAWKLSEPGGRYARVVKRFERWLQGAARILQARKQAAGAGLPHLKGSLADTDADADAVEGMFVEELDPDWKAEVQNLARKLAQWTLQLQTLGDVPVTSHMQGSSLALVVRGVRELVQGMVDEVRTMERVERSMVAAEEAWIREAIEAGGDDEDDEEGRVAGAIWRMG